MQSATPIERSSLTRFAWLSIGAALATIALKSAAYWLTGSVSLLSDAVESLVNLAGAIFALMMVTVAYFAHKNNWGGDIKFEWARLVKAVVERHFELASAVLEREVLPGAPRAWDGLWTA